MYAADRVLDGLILLAAYPTKEAGEPTLEIYGSSDGVLNLKKREKGDRYLPEGSEIFVIDGGNHAQFGNYGDQKGDGQAAVSREEQQRAAARKILDFCGSRGKETE